MSGLAGQPRDLSLRSAAIIAGIGLLFMAILAPLALLYLVPHLVASGNPAATVSNIRGSAELFRTAIALAFVVAVLDVVVAWALYVFFKPVNRSLSLLAGVFRVIYATLLAVAISHLYAALQLAEGSSYGAGLTPDQSNAQVLLSVGQFQYGWSLALSIFGLHLIVLGYLAFAAGYLRRALGILLVIAGAGYLIDSLGQLLQASYSLSISSYTFVGEVVLLIWLFVRGTQVGAATTNLPSS